MVHGCGFTAYSSGFKQTYEQIARANQDAGMFLERRLIPPPDAGSLLLLFLFDAAEQAESAEHTHAHTLCSPTGPQRHNQLSPDQHTSEVRGGKKTHWCGSQ